MPKTAIFLKFRRFLGVFGGLNPPPHHRIYKLTPLPPLAATPRQAHKGLATPQNGELAMRQLIVRAGSTCPLFKLAAFGLAMAFTFSCSSDTGGGGTSNANTYFESIYGIPSNSVCCATLDDDDGDDRPLSDYTFNEITEIVTGAVRECSALRLVSWTNITENELNTYLAKNGYPPAYRKEFMNDLNRRGNNISVIDTRNNPSYQQEYCAMIDYFEKE